MKNGNGTFDQIIENVKKLKETIYDFTCTIKNNYKESSDIEKYIDFIYNIIGNDPRFLIDFHSTGNWSNENKGIPSVHKNSSIEKGLILAVKKGMRVRSLEEDDCYKGYFCAASLNDSFIINHKREIKKCTIMLDWDKNTVGYMDELGRITFNESNLKIWSETKERGHCNRCNVKPLCLQKFCPHMNYNTCKNDIEKKIQLIHKVKYGEQV